MHTRPALPAFLIAVLILGVATVPVFGSEDSHAGHEHADEAAHPLGALHPALVHFPVALAMVAAFAVTMGFPFPGPFFRHAATFTIALAGVSSVPAFLVGLEAGAALGRMSASRQAALDLHQTAGTVTMALLLVAAITRLYLVSGERSPALRWIAAAIVLAGAGAASATGFLGGELTRGAGHLSSVLPW